MCIRDSGATVLPHGTGRSVRVAVFTQGANAEAAKAAGAELVGMEDLAEQIKKGEMNFDVVIASPDAMRVVGPVSYTHLDVYKRQVKYPCVVQKNKKGEH